MGNKVKYAHREEINAKDIPSNILRLLPMFRSDMTRFGKKRAETIAKYFLDIACRVNAREGVIDYAEMTYSRQIGTNRVHWFIDICDTSSSNTINKSKKQHEVYLQHFPIILGEKCVDTSPKSDLRVKLKKVKNEWIAEEID